MNAAWPARWVQAVLLLVAAVGILVQIAGGADYPAVPPGIVILVVAALVLTSLGRPAVVWVGVVVSTFLLLGAVIAPDARDHLGAPADVWTFVGTVLQLAALVAAWLVGVRAVRSREPAA